MFVFWSAREAKRSTWIWIRRPPSPRSSKTCASDSPLGLFSQRASARWPSLGTWRSRFRPKTGLPPTGCPASCERAHPVSARQSIQRIKNGTSASAKAAKILADKGGRGAGGDPGLCGNARAPIQTDEEVQIRRWDAITVARLQRRLGAENRRADVSLP